jgi:hypothetical protein
MKPELTLLPANPSVDDIVAMFERLTGRKATAEERAEAEKLLAGTSRHVSKARPS